MTKPWIRNFFTRNNVDVLPHAVVSGPASSTPLFTASPPSEVSTLDRIGTLIDVNEGQQVVRQCDLGQQCVVMIEGSLDVYRDDEFIASIGPGSFAGEMSMIFEQRCNADVTVAEDSLLYAMNRGEFQSLLAHCPTMYSQIIGTAAQRLASAK